MYKVKIKTAIQGKGLIAVYRKPTGHGSSNTITPEQTRENLKNILNNMQLDLSELDNVPDSLEAIEKKINQHHKSIDTTDSLESLELIVSKDMAIMRQVR